MIQNTIHLLPLPIMSDALVGFLSYLFWPNPGNATYSSPKALALMVFCALLIAGAVGLVIWRRNMRNPVTRKLSRSWPSASFWFGFSGLIMTIARVEQIQYVSMRFLWVLWLAAAIFYLFLQWKLYRMRHYEVLPKEVSTDPRTKYLPKKQKRH